MSKTKKSKAFLEDLEAKNMNLHELVDVLLNTEKVLRLLIEYFKNDDSVNEIFLTDLIYFCKKYKILTSRIMIQYKKEDPSVIIYELQRSIDHKKDEKSLADVIREVLDDYE